jgi:hypothetical protein
MTAPAHQLDVAELLSREPEAMPWRCGQIAADGFVTVLTGHAGEGKSWIALALAVGVACGSDPAGIECRKGNALYLDAENGEWLLHRRIREVDAPRVNLSIWLSDGLDLAKPADVSFLAKIIEAQEVKLLVLDSLRSLAPAMEENSGDSVAPVMTAIRQLARDTGCAVIVLHHRPKNGGGAYRGSSALRDQTDVLWLLGRSEGDPEGKTRRYLRADKMRLAGEPDDLWLKLSHEDGRMSIESADAFAGNKDNAPMIREQLGEQIEQHLTDNPEGLTQTEIGLRLGRPNDDRSMKAALAQLQYAGTIERERPRSPWRLTGGRETSTTTSTTTTTTEELLVVAPSFRKGDDHQLFGEAVGQ